MIDFSSPLLGMTQAENSVNQVAARLANPARDTVDLSAEMVALMSARSSFAVNIKVAQTEDQMAKSLLRIIA